MTRRSERPLLDLDTPPGSAAQCGAPDPAVTQDRPSRPPLEVPVGDPDPDH